MITVASWNVLHRVHAENWRSDIAIRWPDEAARIAAVTAWIAGRPEQVIALQEVSGDQLASLRSALSDKDIHALRYPRVPRPRNGTTPLRDPTEHLVLVLDEPGREIAAESFENDPGNGALAVETAGIVVVATHVTGDPRRTHQLTRLAELAPPDRATVLLGDFNIDRATVASAFGPDFTVAELPSASAPTRPRTSGTKSQFIDHVIVRGSTVRDVAVVVVDGLSDHNFIRATITG
ncbi:endonuclease/exonuclease/phosphatase family protein [Nocardia anaemiae]|uniref:endonuclease/exonuclease/phosphatase family protein n=1 Tax=Nocardia anaemiae TaxID=263910 RepID=UPI0007A5567D|nr:endonuclease/exonuclease/phosphatase family protein [Nocardia anaemiae]